jgi:GrpB-like predicted nucleotidyltransferase (UPF0157 family)
VTGEAGAFVDVVPYSPAWPALFEQERAALQAAAGETATSVEHIGSTAVPGLSAKPTIDILLVTGSIGEFLTRLPRIQALGYDYRAGNTFVGSADHLFLRKVRDGRRTHHLHVLAAGSPEIDEYRLFRDALCSDPGLALEYERVKLALAAKYAADRTKYVIEKAKWVSETLTALHKSPPQS